MIGTKLFSRSWRAAVGVAILSLALAGCGGSSTTTTTGTKTTTTSSITTTATTSSEVKVAVPTGVTLSIPAQTAFTNISGNPVSGTIQTSVSYSTSATDLPQGASSKLPAGTTLAAFVDISMGNVKYFSQPINLTINVSSSGAKTGDAVPVYTYDNTTNAWSFAGTNIVDASGNVSPTVTHLSIWGAFKPTTPPPSAPAGVQVAKGNGQAVVSWTAVSGTTYNVYYSTVPGQEITAGTKIANVTTPQTITGLTSGATYYFVVTALTGNVESVASGEISTTLAPPPPTGVSAAPGDTQATVSWNTVTGATSYNVYYSTTSGQELSGTKVPNAVSGQAIPGLTDGTTYYFVVTAVNANGESVASNEASTTPVHPPPAKPSGIILSGGDGQATIQWTGPTGATSYNVYYSTTAGQELSGTKFTGAVSPQTITGLTNGTTYYFVVTALNAGGESGVSSEKSVAPAATLLAPGTPNGVAVTSPSVGQVHVVWNTVSTATSYNIYYIASATTPAMPNSQFQGWTKVSTTIEPWDLTLTSGTKYYFLVTAVNAAGESPTQSSANKYVTVQ